MERLIDDYEVQLVEPACAPGTAAAEAAAENTAARQGSRPDIPGCHPETAKEALTVGWVK